MPRAAQERAANVDRHHPIPLVDRDLLEGSPPDQQRGIVDESVDVADLIEQRDHILLVTDIADDVTVGKDVGRRDFGSAFAQLADETRADAARPARDDDSLALDTHLVTLIW